MIDKYWSIIAIGLMFLFALIFGYVINKDKKNKEELTPDERIKICVILTLLNIVLFIIYLYLEFGK